MKANMYDELYALEEEHWWYRGKREIVLRLIDSQLGSRKSGVSIADFGCGCGLMINELKKYGNVIGMDYSEYALDYCKTKGKDVELFQNNLEIHKDEFEDKFEFAIALDILEHIENDEIALNNMYSYLRKGGFLIITVPANQWMWSKHDENCMHHRRYTLKTLQSVVNKSGFETEYMSYYNAFLFPPIALIRIIFNMFHLDSDSTMENSLPNSIVNKILYSIFESEGKWIDNGHHFPCGVSLLAILKK